MPNKPGTHSICPHFTALFPEKFLLPLPALLSLGKSRRGDSVIQTPNRFGLAHLALAASPHNLESETAEHHRAGTRLRNYLDLDIVVRGQEQLATTVPVISCPELALCHRARGVTERAAYDNRVQPNNRRPNE